jgi:hypothetical protein
MKVMKQTAVEWLSDNLWLLKEQMANKEITIGQYTISRVKLIERAKEMEKGQIINANRDGVDMVVDKKDFISGEQYYNENFNTNEK